MKEVWIAALSINLSLGLCFMCCFRLFNLCIRYSGALKGLYGDTVSAYVEADEEDPTPARTESNNAQVQAAARQRAAEGGVSAISQLQAQRIAESRRVWLPRTVSAWLTLTTIVFDACAFAAFSFAASTPITRFKDRSFAEVFVKVIQSIAKALLLQFNEDSFAYTYWIAVILAFVSVPVSIYVIVKDSGVNSKANAASQILSSVLLLPIASTIMAVLSCDYSRPEHPVLMALPSLQCWVGLHSAMVGIGLTVFLLYYTAAALSLARLIRAIVDETSQIVRDGGAEAVYLDSRFTVFYFQAKVCIAFVVGYWGSGAYSPWIAISAICVLVVGLAGYNYHARPCNVDVVNSLRMYSFFFALVINTCAAISLITNNWRRIGHWLVLTGVLVWLVACITHYIFEYGGCPECRVFEPSEDDATDALARAVRDAYGESDGAEGGYVAPGTADGLGSFSVEGGNQGPRGSRGAFSPRTSLGPGGAGAGRGGGGEDGLLPPPGPATVGDARWGQQRGARLMYVNLSGASKEPIALI